MAEFRTFPLWIISRVLIGLFSCAAVAQSPQTPPEWKPVEDALGRSGKVQSDGAFKFSMPRKDLKVTVAGTPIKPGLALGSWTAFSVSGDNAMVMGDLGLPKDQHAPSMPKLQSRQVQHTPL